MNHTKVSSIKSRNSPCSDEEWIRILSSILLHEPSKVGEENVTGGVEIHAKVEKKAMTIVVQKVIEGIKVCCFLVIVLACLSYQILNTC